MEVGTVGFLLSCSKRMDFRVWVTHKRFTRVCNRHFRNGDISNEPNKQLGVRFASLK